MRAGAARVKSDVEPLCACLRSGVVATTSFGDAVEVFLHHSPLTERRNAYRRSLKRLDAWCTEERLDPLHLGHGDMVRFVKHLNQGTLASGTVNQVVSACESAIDS